MYYMTVLSSANMDPYQDSSITRNVFDVTAWRRSQTWTETCSNYQIKPIWTVRLVYFFFVVFTAKYHQPCHFCVQHNHFGKNSFFCSCLLCCCGLFRAQYHIYPRLSSCQVNLKVSHGIEVAITNRKKFKSMHMWWLPVSWPP
jgi:hypothetical protein